MRPALQILVDADACPVKEEVYTVALRHGVSVVIVSNRALRVPAHPLISRYVVSDAFDAADNWIAQACNPTSVVITADILLADRCLKLVSVRARGVISGVGDGVFRGGACPTPECGVAGGHRVHRYGGVCTLQP